MPRFLYLLLALLLAGCPTSTPDPANDDDAVSDDDDATGADDDDATSGDDDDSTSGDDDDATPDFLADVSGAVCDALLGCCGVDDHALYFAGPAANELLAGLVAQMPPNAALDAATCPALVADMFAITPFGDWLAAVETGAVLFDSAAYDACLADLQGASCGEELRTALFDPTCFGFGAPSGGEQRAVFDRWGTEGVSCTPLRDGIGAGFYGTCDPRETFCCYEDGSGTCGMPFDEGSAPRTGTCAPASAEGEPCGYLGGLQLCQSGLECIADVCEAPITAPLAQGEACIDSGFQLLGECVDGWCDLFGSRNCEPLRDDGASCLGAEECASGVCDAGACVPNTICGE